MSMTVTGTPETISLAPLAKIDAKPTSLNNLYSHRLRESDRGNLKKIIEKDVESIYSIIMNFEEPELKEKTANIKELLDEYRSLKFYKESSLEMPLILAVAGTVSPLCFGVAGTLYLIGDGVRKVHVIPSLTAEKLAKVCDVFWKDSNNYKTLFSDNGGSSGLQADDVKRVEWLPIFIRRMAIAGKIIELDQKNEENAILKVLSEFVKFKEGDLKQLACKSSEKQYYQDGTKCSIYKNILKMQRNQWNKDDSIQDIWEPETLIDIIEEVARHTRRLRAIDAEIEEFPDYCAPEIPQEVDTVFKLEVEEQFVVL